MGTLTYYFDIICLCIQVNNHSCHLHCHTEPRSHTDTVVYIGHHTNQLGIVYCNCHHGNQEDTGSHLKKNAINIDPFHASHDIFSSAHLSDISVLPRPRSRKNIAKISAKSRPKHPSCESCRGGIFINSQSKLSVLLF